MSNLGLSWKLEQLIVLNKLIKTMLTLLRSFLCECVDSTESEEVQVDLFMHIVSAWRFCKFVFDHVHILCISQIHAQTPLTECKLQMDLIPATASSSNFLKTKLPVFTGTGSQSVRWPLQTAVHPVKPLPWKLLARTNL